jgi:hypothetical protein
MEEFLGCLSQRFAEKVPVEPFDRGVFVTDPTFPDGIVS